MERVISYADAIQEATEQEMKRDHSVVVMGIGVDDFKAVYGTTHGLVEKFGAERVIDTPLSEDGMTGAAIGMALAGLRPIHVHIRADFVLLAMNQLVNMAAKAHYMYGGAVSVPLVVRSVIGRSWGQGAQHSQGLHSLFMHIPGLKVVAPTTPYDAKGTLISSVRDGNPIMFMEHRMLHYIKGHVPPEPYSVPLGQARVLAQGTDVTLVGISWMAIECMRARSYLKEVGINAEVVDPLTLNPLDMDTIASSIQATRRLLVVDTAWTACGATAEILAQTAERFQGQSDIRLQRMGYASVTCPTTRALETLFYPDAQSIAAAAYNLVRGEGDHWTPQGGEAQEIVQFKGPF